MPRRKTLILTLLPVLALSSVLSAWLFVPVFRAACYQGILVLGPPDARLWAVRQSRSLDLDAMPVLALALEDEDFGVFVSAVDTLVTVWSKGAPQFPQRLKKAMHERARIQVDEDSGTAIITDRRPPGSIHIIHAEQAPFLRFSIPQPSTDLESPSRIPR